MTDAASSDDLTLGDIEEQEMWEEHTRERREQMASERSAADAQELRDAAELLARDVLAMTIFDPVIPRKRAQRVIDLIGGDNEW